MNPSLKARLLLGTIAGMALIPLVLGVTIYSIVSQSLQSSFDQNLHARSKNLYSRVYQKNGRIHAEWDASSLASYQLGLHPDYFQLLTKDGRVVARSPSLGQGHLQALDLSQGNIAYDNLTLPNGQSGRMICLEFLPNFDDDDDDDDEEFFEDEEEFERGFRGHDEDEEHREEDEDEDEEDDDDEGEDDDDEDEEDHDDDEREEEREIEERLRELDREYRHLIRQNSSLSERTDYLAGIMNRYSERKKRAPEQQVAKGMLIQRVSEDVQRAMRALNDLENQQEEWEQLEEKRDGHDLIDGREALLEELQQRSEKVAALIFSSSRIVRKLMREHKQLFSHLKNQVRQPLVLIVARESTELQSQLSFLQWLLFSGALGTLLLASGVGYAVVNQGLKPLDQLAKEIEGIHPQSLGERIEVDELPAEMLPVGERLNQLLDRLQAAFDRERRFSANVAHELRTPIAGLLSMIEVTSMKTRSVEDYKETLGDCFEISQGMQKVVHSLLMLDKLETGQVPISLERCSSKELIERCWIAFSERAAAKELQFQLEVSEHHQLEADPEILRLIITNLLSNALEHSDRGGSLTISEGRSHGLVFSNSGCQLSQSSIERVFDRFWRGDSARGQTGQHSGLGLALVQRATAALGGHAEARLSGKDHFVIEIILGQPLEPSPASSRS